MSDKFSPDFLAAVKAQYNLAEFLTNEMLLELTPQPNGEFLGRCPFHSEGTASFRVNALRYHCFGCKAHGDIFSFYAHATKKPFPEVVRILANRAEVKPGEAIIARPIVSHTPYDANATLRILEVNRLALDFFRSCDWEADALSYAKSRLGLRSIGEWCIGYAPADGRLLIDFLYGSGVEYRDVMSSGLVAEDRRGNAYSRLRDRLVLPIMGHRHEYPVGFIGRLIPREPPIDAPKYMLPPTTAAFRKSQVLFGFSRVEQSALAAGHIIVVEGSIDAIVLNSRGCNAVSILGSDISSSQINSLSKFHHIILMLDPDPAGMSGVLRAGHALLASKPHRVSIALLPSGSDPATYFSNASTSIKSLPIISLEAFMSESIVTRVLRPEYDRTYLDKVAHPWVKDNILQGFPHYNVVDYVMRTWPQFAQEIKSTALKMVREVEEVGGRKMMKEGNVKEFLKAWMKPSREVRKLHGKK